MTAIALGDHAAATTTGPRTFICDDHAEYWVKRRAPSGLLAELVAGRLAEQLGVGPHVVSVRVPWEALPRDGSLGEFKGVFVGSEHVPTGMADRSIRLLLRDRPILPKPLDEESRALVIAFHTWVNGEDPQVLVELESGRVLTIDHGQCFRELLKGPPSRVVITPIPGIPDSYGLRVEPMDRALSKIEALTQQDILAAVACAPEGDHWRSLQERRLSIAEWLMKRQFALREVMSQWTHRVS